MTSLQGLIVLILLFITVLLFSSTVELLAQEVDSPILGEITLEEASRYYSLEYIQAYIESEQKRQETGKIEYLRGNIEDSQGFLCIKR